MSATLPATSAEIGPQVEGDMWLSLRLTEPHLGMALLNTAAQGFNVAIGVMGQTIMTTRPTPIEGSVFSPELRNGPGNRMTAEFVVRTTGRTPRTTQIHLSWGEGFVETFTGEGLAVLSEGVVHTYPVPGVYPVRCWTDQGQVWRGDWIASLLPFEELST